MAVFSTFVSEFGDLMTDTATWAAFVSRDDFGSATFATGTDLTCRLVRKHKMVRDMEGDEVLSTAQLWVLGNSEITPEDRITLSDATTPIIAAIERFQDEYGASHTKVYFR